MFDYPTLKALRKKIIEVAQEADGGAWEEDDEEDDADFFGVSRRVKDLEVARSSSSGIVISGRGCRFVQSWTPEGLWQEFLDGNDGIGVIPRNRWKWEDMFDEDVTKEGKSVSKWGGFFKGLELFDASFFAISPREATAMDPRGRMLLETGWECAEDAGLNPLELEKDTDHTVGVYVGT